MTALTANDLQYFGPDPIDVLADVLVPRLKADGIPVAASDLVIGSAAQQFMVLALQVLVASRGLAKPLIAVEEPGYGPIFDAYEYAGYGLLGIEMDEHGAVPASLDLALASGAQAVLLTPRAHNPTGASWTSHRRGQLADVLENHPGVLVIEDDQFADLASCRPGSLLEDSRLEDRVIYIRSFSKTIAPDLRIAVAAARPVLRSQLAEAKAFADGWTPHMTQRVLATVLADANLGDVLDAARLAYARRRMAAATALTDALNATGEVVMPGDDGVNVWVQLPPDTDASTVIEHAAVLGVLIAPGEPFFVRPGHNDVLRINAGSVTADEADRASRLVAAAIGAAQGVRIDAVAV